LDKLEAMADVEETERALPIAWWDAGIQAAMQVPADREEKVGPAVLAEKVATVDYSS